MMSYLQTCEICAKESGRVKKLVVVKPIVSNEFNSRYQVDLIDMQSQPDGEYNFILDYQDHLTKFCILWPLKWKTKDAVAEELTSIFSIIDAPHILESDNGREFANQLVEEITKLWPECKMVHGKLILRNYNRC